MPDRIQLRRARGWRLPDGAVKVDRTTLFGNPFKGPRAVEVYRDYLARPGGFHVECGPDEGVQFAYVPAWHHARDVLDALPRLRGRDLACWCPLPTPGEPDHCHAAVLLELANDGGDDE